MSAFSRAIMPGLVESSSNKLAATDHEGHPKIAVFAL
jgi:hypothetical protein